MTTENQPTDDNQSNADEALLDEAIANGLADDTKAQEAESPIETHSGGNGDQDATMATEISELKDRLLRSQAELENFRRRTQKEQLDAMKYQALPVIRDMLPGIDNLQRAVDAAEQSGDTQNLIQGIKMVTQQFTDVLKQHKAEPLTPEGEAFDPNLHEALSQVPTAEVDPMTVVQVVETGYRIHDRIIRPAKVLVSCAPPQPAAEQTTAEDGNAAE